MSTMYRAVQLTDDDRFVWRSGPDENLQDHPRATFGVSVSIFAANMSVCHNAVQLGL
jgi:hypothetical protein